MHKVLALAAVGVLLATSACATENDGQIGAGAEDAENERSGVESADQCFEEVGDVDPEMTRGEACRAACWGAAGLGCGAVGAVCTGGTVITIGGFALPCTVAVPAACAASGVGGSLCSDWCTANYGV